MLIHGRGFIPQGKRYFGKIYRNDNLLQGIYKNMVILSFLILLL